MKVTRRCCVVSCNETNDRNHSFFRFPDLQKNIDKWKKAIGLDPSFVVDRNTFICVKHFAEKDIAQRADRKTGQKARLRYGCIPRLHLEPIKEEVEEKTKDSDEPATNIETEESSWCNYDYYNYNDKYECYHCKESFITSAHLFQHIRAIHSTQPSRTKISMLLPLIQPLETIYSSESDCEYEIAVSIKKRNKGFKLTEFKEKLKYEKSKLSETNKTTKGCNHRLNKTLSPSLTEKFKASSAEKSDGEYLIIIHQ